MSRRSRKAQQLQHTRAITNTANKMASIIPIEHAQGWEVSPSSKERIIANLTWQDAQRFEQSIEKYDSAMGVNTTAGFRRTEIRADALEKLKKPPAGQETTDPPVANILTWNARTIQHSIDEHDLGVFTNSGYLVEAMISDASVAHALNARTKGLTKRKHYFSPNKRAKNKKLAKYISDEFQELYQEIIPQEITEQIMLWTPMMGFDVHHMSWDYGLENLFLPTMRHWHPAYTFFLMAGNLEDRRLHLITMGDGVGKQGTYPVDPGGEPEFFCWTPYGYYRGWLRGALRLSAIPWLVRNLTLRDWSRLSEVHGIPIRIVKVPANASEPDKARIFAKAQTMGSEPVFVLPMGDGTSASEYDIILLEPKNEKSWEIFKELNLRCSSDIELGVHGTQLMGALGEGGGKSSSMAASKSVRSEDNDYSDSDAIKFCSAIRKQILRLVVAYNYEDADDCVPNFILSDEPPQDKAQNAKAWLDLSTAFVNFKTVGFLDKVDMAAVAEEFEVPLNEKLLDEDADVDESDGDEDSEKESYVHELRKTTTIQTILISKDKFSLTEAKAWLKDHKFHFDVDKKEDTYRFRQREPSEFLEKSFRTIEITDGIQYVIGKLKPE